MCLCFLVCYETEAVDSVYLSAPGEQSVGNLFCFFLLAEADIILAFNDFCGLTVDVHEYLTAVLACQNALSPHMPLSIIFKLSLIAIKDLFLVLL